ncbi:MAG: methyltransferase domain-containing protein [Nanoarchaeota archaeon]|nr:methyltransferase domain-containing protein [Nanoarchaeota archaeon]
MTHAITKQVYDAFGDTYYSPQHNTIRYFNAIQAFPIRIAFAEQARFLRKPLEEVDVLNIGVGNGQHCEQLCLPIYKHVVRERVRWDRITDFDISSAMLQAAKGYYPSEEYQRRFAEREPLQVQGDVLELQDILPSESFDIVLAGLCDNVEDQKRIYEEAFKVLRPQGMFIVTYPHKTLMTIIRQELYGIHPAFTRFLIDGREYLVPSFTPEPEDIEELFSDAGFEAVQAENLYHDQNFDFHNQAISNTVRKAQKKSVEDLPVLVLGTGRKPDGLTELERKEKRDPWFWYN